MRVFTTRVPRYEVRQRRYTRLATRTQRFISRVAAVRFFAFAAAAVCGLASFYDSQFFPYGPIGLLGGVIFLVAVWIHRGPFALLPRLLSASDLCGEDQARVDQRWLAIEDGGEAFLEGTDPALAELQVFGRNSVFKLIDHTGLPTGRARLADLLQKGLEADEIESRQHAVQSLRRLGGWCRRFQIESHLCTIDESHLEKMFVWGEGPATTPKWLNATAVLSVVLAFTTFTQIAFTLAGYDTLWTLSFAAQVMLFFVGSSRISSEYSHLIGEAEQRPIVALNAMYSLIEGRQFQDQLLQKLQLELKGGESRSGVRRLTAFENIVEMLSVKHSPSLYAALGICLGWEFIQCARLERWRCSHGKGLRREVGILSEFEVLGSLASFARTHPSYAWPVVHPDTESDFPPWSAKSLGHPLIHASKRCVNDFEIPNAGTLVLVTGSNMSGKSTFLRTLGLNARLALAGAPVCAESLSLVACQLSTSIQVVDVPEEGWSRFYAEVKRIRGVLEELEGADDGNGRPVFYLVDEMLSGTNSRERRLACHSIVRTLANSRRGFGLVTTHDLDLVDVGDDLATSVVCAHFSDQFDGDALTFDYTLRPGVAQTTNALQVLQMEGIHVARESEVSSMPEFKS